MKLALHHVHLIGSDGSCLVRIAVTFTAGDPERKSHELSVTGEVQENSKADEDEDEKTDISRLSGRS